MAQVNLRIDGMHCGACVKRAGQALQSVPGVKTEALRVGAVRLECEDPASVDAAIAALGKAGYTAQREE